MSDIHYYDEGHWMHDAPACCRTCGDELSARDDALCGRVCERCHTVDGDDGVRPFGDVYREAYDAPEQVKAGTYDAERPDTGNVRWDGLIVNVGGLVRGIGWFAEAICDGNFRHALRAKLGTHQYALDATDWAERIEQEKEREWEREARGVPCEVRP